MIKPLKNIYTIKLCLFGALCLALCLAGGQNEVKAQNLAKNQPAPNTDMDGKALDHFVRAENLRRSKRFIEAIDEYDKAIVADANNFKFTFSKGICYFMVKDAVNCINSLQQSVVLKQDYVASHVLLAQCYRTQKKYDEMIRALDNAFKYDADLRKKSEYKTEIIQTLVRNKEYAKAKPHILQAKSVAPSDAVVLFYEGKVANELGDYKTAKESLIKAMTELPNDPKVRAKYWYELGYAYYRLNQFDNAWDTWKNVANYGPFKMKIARYDPKVYLNNALCYFKIYDYAKAKENASIALKMQPNLSQAYVLMAEAERKEAKHETAIGSYTKAISVENDPARKAEIHKSLAYALMESQRFGEVINAAMQSLKTNPGDYNLHFLQAAAHYRMKNYLEAAKVIENLLGNPALDPESRGQFNFALGVIYKLTNQSDKAKVAFKRAELGSFARSAQLELATLEGHAIEDEEPEAADKPMTMPKLPGESQ
jgi:tetratricopeptide (TPR) repeat protein